MPNALSLVRLRDAETLSSTVSRTATVDIGEIGLHQLWLVYKFDIDSDDQYQAWTEMSFDGTTWWADNTFEQLRQSGAGQTMSEVKRVVIPGQMRYFRNAASNFGTGTPVLTLDYVIA